MRQPIAALAAKCDLPDPFCPLYMGGTTAPNPGYLYSNYYLGWIGPQGYISGRKSGCSVFALSADKDNTFKELNLSQDWLLLMAGDPNSQGSPLLMIVWFGLIFLVMYFLMIRPQRKRQKEHEALLKDLKKGDKVVTSGGMFGTIFAIDEEKGRVVLKIGEEVKMEFLRSSISGKVDK